MIRIVIACLWLLGCAGEHRAARVAYNDGVAKLAAGDYEGAEKALLDARSRAGVDPELRFRAAYDLGLAYAAHAEKVKSGKDGDPAKALELARQSMSWFNDALRLRKDDANTQQNLAIVRARVQALADELRRAEGKLEARLDAVIGAQREVLDGARAAWLAIKQTTGADPLAQQSALTGLADRERGVVAEVGVISDLAADEIDQIAKKAEDKREEDEKSRMVQLKSVDIYLTDARQQIAHARRKLQELAAEDGVARAEAALAALKRAREQLLDPVQVLRGVGQDQLELLRETSLATGDPPAVGLAPAKAEPKGLPAWLAPAALAEREGGLHDRIEEVRARLSAAMVAPTAPEAQPDPKREKLLDRVRLALPSVTEATSAMERARQSLVEGKPAPAVEHQQAALVAIAKAIEQFSDLKQTIELAYRDHDLVVKLLGPDAAKELAPAERAKQTREGLARNVDRMPRLKELIAEEVVALEQQAAQAAPQPAPAAGSGSAAPDPAEAAKQQLEQAKQRLARAEELRAQAATALDQLGKALAAQTTDPLVPARDAHARLDELRKMFFSVIEHLEQLIRDQGETRDQTSAIAGQDDLQRGPKLPGLITREDDHGTLAKAVTDALAAQADAAGKQPPQPGAPDAKALSAAAAETRLAQNEIGSARDTLVKARDATRSSESIAPAVDSQAKAIEHLENALRLLQPPKQDQQDKQDKQEQQQQQQQEQQQQQGGAAQRARDKDAEQQRKKREQEQAPDPVEKDW